MGTVIFDAEQIALDAVALVTAIAELYLQTQYIDLANDYFDLYKRQRQFYYDNFQGATGFEVQFADLAFVTPLLPQGQSGTSYQKQYTQQNALISNFASPLTLDNFYKVWWANHANMYGDVPLTAEPDVLDLQATIDDYSTYLDRYEEHRKDVYDERTWEWQNQSLNLGVKQATVVQSGLATSFAFLDETSTGLADWFATQSNGLSTYSAYRKNEAGTTALLAARAGNAKRMAMNITTEQQPAAQTFAIPNFANNTGAQWQTITN